MNTGQFTNTSTNMVQVVTNIINGYKMGALRALAQEPVQNALDAVRSGRKKVEVEYRLLRRVSDSGETCFLLTVTDRGTTGLRGPMVATKELQQRNYQLKPEENWAAFEAQGYTKVNEDALGSRGQGKSAFLYHSHVPGDSRRMLMLYDTLLEDDEYRLGMRYARPVDQVMAPPLFDDAARHAIRSAEYAIDDDMTVPLGLEPLRDIGARIIVPYLDHEQVDAMRPGGELARWLQRCWWRAIQIGKLSIRIVDDISGKQEQVVVPSWWRDLPREQGRPSSRGNWHDMPDGGRACSWGGLAFGDGNQIKRLVLLHSDALDNDNISGEPEYSGIQLLRGSQWIETYGASEEYGDMIPADQRAGFRGYVEFAHHTDNALRQRSVENSQHDRFNRRLKIIEDLRYFLKDRVREFSDAMGWEAAPDKVPQLVTEREKTTLTRLVETFLNPQWRKSKHGQGKGEPNGNQLIWDLRLDLDYPDPKSARVDWGHSIRRVYVEVGVEPSEELVGSADLILEWVDAAGNAKELRRIENAITKQWGKDRAYEQFELGDWQILRGKASREKQIACPEPGECKLRAVLEYRGQRVKSTVRTVYVHTEPPPPQEKNAITLSINAVNADDGNKRRIDHGEVLRIEFKARNRLPDTANVYLNATFSNEVLARNMPVELPGTPAGDTPTPLPVLSISRQLLDPHQSAPLPTAGNEVMYMPKSSGIFRIGADLVDEHGNLIANSSKSAYFQRDPYHAKNELPFDIRKVSQQKEMWKLNGELSELTYQGEYPLYKELKEMQRLHYPLHGRQAFIAEISANGLLEWALRPKDQGDDSNYDQLLDSIGNPEESLWEAYTRRLEKLGNGATASPLEFAQIWRETVAIMLEIFTEQKD